MNALVSTLSHPPVARAAAALLHFLWQGAVVGLVLAALEPALRRRTPQIRYAVFCAALFAMLMLPAVTFSGLGSAPAKADTLGQSGALLAAPETLSDAPDAVASAGLPAALSNLSRSVSSAAPWVLAAWTAGVLFFSGRFLRDWLSVRRLSRKNARPADRDRAAAVSQLALRLGIRRPVRLLESAAVAVPVAIGAIRPAILVPVSALTGLSPRELEALLAHELAHVRRHDYLVNLAQCLAETLLFYHPAVWWISGRIRAEREKCCDDLAVAATGDARAYARALVGLAELSMDGGGLALAATGRGQRGLLARITRLFPQTSQRRASAPWIVGAVAAGGLLLFGAAAKLASDVVRPAASAKPIGPEVSLKLRSPAARSGRGVEDFVRVSARIKEDDPVEAIGQGDAEPGPEDLATLAKFGVTPEFVRGIVAAGYDGASAQELVSLHVHGVTADYVSRMKSTLADLSLESAVDLAIHGVTPDYVAGMTAAGLNDLTADEARTLRIHGVTADYVRAVRAAGYEAASTQEIVGLRSHDVDPRDAAEWLRLGFTQPDIETLTTLKNYGVRPDFARALAAAGLAAESFENLVALKNHGVAPELVRALKTSGLANFSVEETIALRNHGITPELVGELATLGYTELSPEVLISIRNHGVTPEFIRKANHAAPHPLSIDQLVDLRTGGER
jgi:beta-lactamase regulating signal transducer with metallopeptidase domain